MQKSVFGYGLLASEGDLWLQQRRTLQKVFSINYLQDYSRSVTKITSEFINEWCDGEKRIVTDDFLDLTLRIASHVFFGIEFTEKKQIIRELTESLKDIFSAQSRFSWFADNFFPTKKNVRFKKAVQNIDLLIAQLIKQKQKHKTNLLSVLLEVENDEQRNLSDKQIRDEIVTFLIAGHETTAITLSWVWVLLSENPFALKKLQSELHNTLNGSLPNFSDLSKLAYLQKIIKESLRLFPPNRSVARETTKKIFIQGYPISKGSQIVASQWVLHRDKRYFDKPNMFLPDRWSRDFEKKLPKYAYFPFGIGNRTCIGKSFAMMEVSLILAIVAQKFEINLDKNQETEPVPVILLRPKGKLTTTLKQI